MSGESAPDAVLAADMRGMLEALRLALQGAGYTQAKAAAALGVSVATLRRWLGGQGLALENFAGLCALAGVTFSDLAQEAVRHRRYAPLTLAQEQALTADPALSTVFFILAAGWPETEATDAFAIPPELVDESVARLDRLALIDRLPGGRLRARIDLGHLWARKPLLRHFDRHMKRYFFDVDYSSSDVIFGLETVKLSAVGVARVQELIQEFRRKLRDVAERDRLQTRLPTEWYGVLAVARALSGLRRAPDGDG